MLRDCITFFNRFCLLIESGDRVFFVVTIFRIKTFREKSIESYNSISDRIKYKLYRIRKLCPSIAWHGSKIQRSILLIDRRRWTFFIHTRSAYTSFSICYCPLPKMITNCLEIILRIIMSDIRYEILTPLCFWLAVSSFCL